MKYMLMIYDNPDTRAIFFGAGGESLMAEMNTLMAELTESGELVSTSALADPSSSRTVRVRDGVPVVTDGPFAEAKEHFGGYLILDCGSEARVLDVAARWPNARFTAMEVRPILNTSGEEM